MEFFGCLLFYCLGCFYVVELWFGCVVYGVDICCVFGDFGYDDFVVFDGCVYWFGGWFGVLGFV